ncbi:hypothetical protein I4641_05780 [Waterburya agarophytonicola K14]|uniref:DUF4114 domain-containing protein n=1 Tax=Waterburya agarophytonicola KI4 TaxID=2874699 RepID=A0A964FF06_9CYAN|nr:hypothetical protein [Waterburya agarophytonicola]MCC0176487.1 hypothetical protein [Waterburya agarophytonicola KI4]
MKLSQSTIKFVPKLSKLLKPNLTCLGISFGVLGLLNVMSLSAVAEDIVGNQGVKFDEDTIVEFEFIESHGAYQSTFGVIDLDSCQAGSDGGIIFDSCDKTPLLSEVQASDSFDFDDVYRESSYETDLQAGRNNDFLGTPGKTVPNYLAEYTFKADKIYAFYLESQFDGKPAGVVYTTNLINDKGNRQALFHEEDLTTQTVAQRRNTAAFDANKFDALIDGGLLVNLDDTGSALVKTDNEDADFDDFIVGIGGYICNPTQASEPHLQDKKISRQQ